jgi:hypothetical protein
LSIDKPEPSRTTQSRAFRRIPKGIWQKLGPSPGSACEEAIRNLLERRRTEEILYRAVGRGGELRNVRLDDGLYDEMRRASEEDNVLINEFFITALRQYIGDD